MARIVICIDCQKKRPHHAKGLCKPCYNRRWVDEHREEYLAYHQQWYKDHRQEQRAYCRRYYEEHREAILVAKARYHERHRARKLVYLARWRQENSQKRKIAMRRWVKENRENMVASAARRRARLRAVACSLTAQGARDVLGIAQCFYCGRKFSPDDLTLDHFVPLIEGGGTTRANIVAACRTCNSAKGIKMPSEILEQLSL